MINGVSSPMRGTVGLSKMKRRRGVTTLQKQKKEAKVKPNLRNYIQENEKRKCQLLGFSPCCENYFFMV